MRNSPYRSKTKPHDAAHHHPRPRLCAIRVRLHRAGQSATTQVHDARADQASACSHGFHQAQDYPSQTHRRVQGHASPTGHRTSADIPPPGLASCQLLQSALRPNQYVRPRMHRQSGSSLMRIHWCSEPQSADGMYPSCPDAMRSGQQSNAPAAGIFQTVLRLHRQISTQGRACQNNSIPTQLTSVPDPVHRHQTGALLPGFQEPATPRSASHCRCDDGYDA